MRKLGRLDAVGGLFYLVVELVKLSVELCPFGVVVLCRDLVSLELHAAALLDEGVELRRLCPVRACERCQPSGCPLPVDEGLQQKREQHDGCHGGEKGLHEQPAFCTSPNDVVFFRHCLLILCGYAFFLVICAETIRNPSSCSLDSSCLP